MSSAMQQLVNILGVLSNEWMGAQALNSFDTYLAPFIKKDKMSDAEVKQCIQAFLFNSNMPSRWAGQAPFSNVTLDIFVPKDIENDYPKIGGRKASFTYGEIQEEVTRFDKLFIEVFEEGDSEGNAFQYPILTLNATHDFFERIDPDLAERIWKLTAKHGTPYFSNYVNSDMDPSELRSMCCRLRLDLRELTKKNGSLFGAGESTGSIGVVTLNLPKCGFQSHNEEELFQRIERVANLAAKSLDLKRKQLTSWFETGLYPYTKRYLPDGFMNHFSTIGVVGMNEMCRNFFINSKKKDRDISTKEGQALAIKVLEYLRKKCSDYQEQYSTEKYQVLFNLESTPAESTSFRLAYHDRQKFPAILTAGTVENPYYTNSSNLPVNFTTDPWEALAHQVPLQTLYTGGTVFHTFTDDNHVAWDKVRDFIKKVLYETKIPYITWSPTLKTCLHGHGMFINDVTDVCPECKRIAEEGYRKKLKELEDEKYAIRAQTNSGQGA
jgi:ribonucleoside-triphosphate reductase